MRTKQRTAFGRHVRTGVPADVFERLDPRTFQAILALGELMAEAQADAARQWGDYPTLVDIVTMNGSDAVAGLIDEAATAHPEINLGFSRTISGISYKTLVRTGVPSVSFRYANEGTATTKGAYTNRTVETFIMTPEWQCDQAVGDRHEDGAEALIALEASAILEGAFQTLASQFYYGDSNDAKGFPGLIDSYDSTNMAIDAGGTTASINSSAFLVAFGPRDVGWVWGQNGSLEVSDVTLQRVLDGSGNPFWAYCQNLQAYPGLQVCSTTSVARVHSINGTDANAALTDDDLANALATFPPGKMPNVILMTPRSRAELRASRTATNPTGAPAPFPDEAFGVPIAATQAITDTEEPA